MSMIYEAEQGNATIVVGGDAMVTRRLAPFREPAFLGLVDLLRSADASVVNLEMLFHHFEMSWNYKGAYSFQVSDPQNLEDLKWMGIKAVTTANNHSFDYSEAGFLTSLEHCRQRGLAQAGGGNNLGQARAPAYLDTPGGRVAVMGSTSSFTEESRAGPGRSDFPGKPGVSALRHEAVHHVPERVLDALRETRRELGYDRREEAQRRQAAPRSHSAGREDGEVRFMTERFREGDFRTATSCNRADLDDIARWMRGAKRQADWLVYGVHCHESNPASPVWHGQGGLLPPEFLVEAAHFAVDQGADLFFSHGPHFLRGIEIYQGRPIFYSLGNFIFQNDTVEWVPSEAYAGLGLGEDHTPGDWGWSRSGGGQWGHASNPIFYRSVVAACEYRDGSLSEIRLHPIDLGFGRAIAQRGRPVLAGAEVGQEVLRWLQEVSKPYGTDVQIRGDIGVIRP